MVSSSYSYYPSLVLVQPRKTHPYITERLLMRRKQSNQTNKSYSDFHTKHFLSSPLETEGSDEACTQVQAGHGLQLYLHKIYGSNLNWYDLGLLTARIPLV